MKTLTESIKLSLVTESLKKINIIDSIRKGIYRTGLLDTLPKEMPDNLKAFVYALAKNVKTDIKTEKDIYDYFAQAFDEFWLEFEKNFDSSMRRFITGKIEWWNMDELDNIWKTWKSQIIEIFNTAN